MSPLALLTRPRPDSEHLAALLRARGVDSLIDPSVDIMPTLLEICGVEIPAEVQGRSFLSLLDAGGTPTWTEVYYEVCRETGGPEAFLVPERGVRTRERLFVCTEAGPVALYDVENDPHEMTNLVNSASHESTIRELGSLLDGHMHATGDDWSIEASFPPPDFQTHAEGRRRVPELLRRAIVEP